MKKGRRGLVIGGMVLGLLMGCNNGIADELSVEKSLGEIGRSTEKAFYSFIDFIADTLGFTVKADTPKSAVGDHFNKLGVKIGEASAELEKVAEKAVVDGDKEGLLSKAIKEAVDSAKNTLSTLKTHLEALKDIGDSSKVGEVGGNSQQGEAANTEKLKAVHKALKGIVDEAGKAGVTELKKGNSTVAQASTDTPKNGAKILATGSQKPSDGDAALASSIVSAVSGEEILAAIVNSAEGDAAKTVDSTANGKTSAVKFAKGGTNAGQLARDEALAGAVSGGIALRSLVKDGKLASHTANDDKASAQSAGVEAVNKLLVAVEDIIKKTVKNVLEKAKGEIDKARDSKATAQQ